MAQHPKIIIRRDASFPPIKRAITTAREKEWDDPSIDGMIVICYRNGRGNKVRVKWDYAGPDGGRPAEVESVIARTADAVAEYMIPPEYDSDDEAEFGAD